MPFSEPIFSRSTKSQTALAKHMLGIQHSTWYRALRMHMHAICQTACDFLLCITVSACACMTCAAIPDCHCMSAMYYLGKRRGRWECGGVLSTSGVTHITAYTVAVLHNRLAFYAYALYLLSCLYDLDCLSKQLNVPVCCLLLSGSSVT